MRRFTPTATAGMFCQGHALIRNLGQGFLDLTDSVSPRLRLATAWPVLALALSDAYVFGINGEHPSPAELS